jgi:hypothetical protein
MNDYKLMTAAFFAGELEGILVLHEELLSPFNTCPQYSY